MYWIVIPRTDSARIRLRRWAQRNKIKYHKPTTNVYIFNNTQEIRDYLSKQPKNFEREHHGKIGAHIKVDMYIFKSDWICTPIAISNINTVKL